MKLASIDLGTNTCNLCIADWFPNCLNILHSEKQPILLGAEGFANGEISQAAISRVINVLKRYKTLINEHQVSDTQVFATSGVRNAKNQDDIIHQVKTETGFDLNVLSGIEEAEVIYKGVSKAYPLGDDNVFMLDIGGGSIEMQIANKHTIHWQQSVDFGIARLLNQFKPSDPLTENEQNKVL
ncbi:MAG: hypothetical protein MI749_15370, partial [Desulfovibrionales bacterium]|nr:hypothetical protein [Desulfovibrionales bacterium]